MTRTSRQSIARRLAASAVAAAALSGPNPAFAVNNITAGELALTPPFCQDVQVINKVSPTNPTPRAAHWVSLMGETFWAMHHYCWALVNLQRANRGGLPQQQRHFLMREAIADFYYVIKSAPSGFVLLPELFYRAGDVYAQLGDHGAAAGEYGKSRAVKADYWPPYAGEAKLLAKLGMKDEALRLLDKGLELMPNEPNLVAAADEIRTSPKRPAAKQK